MATRSAGAAVVFGYWETQTGAPDTAPSNGKYRADSWAAPTLLAISKTDADAHSRNMTGITPGDALYEIASNDSQNYQSLTVTSIVDNGTWVRIGVTVVESGTAFVAPGSNQSRLLQIVHPATVTPTPPTATVTLPPLATPDDIVARMGRNLNQTEAARVDSMLKDGSAIIRRRARNTFMYQASDLITISASDGIIVLPGRPIYQVLSVLAKSGHATVPDIPVTWFIFDGVDTVTIPEPSYSGIINLPTFWYEAPWYSHSYDTTYEHGYHDVPADIQGMLCSAIVSELATPTQSTALQGEVIGAYSYSMRRREGGSGIYAALVEFGMNEMLADYRTKAGSIPVRRS